MFVYQYVVLLTRSLNEVWKESYIYPLVRDNSIDLSGIYNLLVFRSRLVICKAVSKLCKCILEAWFLAYTQYKKGPDKKSDYWVIFEAIARS